MWRGWRITTRAHFFPYRPSTWLKTIPLVLRFYTVKVSRFLPLAALVWAQACAIYNEGLLDDGDDDNVDASGGKTSSGGKASTGGKNSSGDGGTSGSGGRSSGGSASGGRSSSGGAPNPSSGGASGGEDGSGGDASESGGASSGGAGTGGTPAVGPFLVTDMSKSTHSNSPFFGKIERYSQGDTVWAESAVSDMLVPRESGSSNLALQVAATFTEDDWGVDIAITLKSGQAFDLSSYKTLTFELKGVDQETSLRIGLEDFASHRGSTLCDTDGVGDDCDKHVEALSTPVPDSDWETIELDLDAGTFDGCGLGCERENALDLTRVYAIHFKMDPPEDVGVDFSIDNIYIDN